MLFATPFARKAFTAFVVFCVALVVYRFYQFATYDNLPVKPPAECRELCGD